MFSDERSEGSKTAKSGTDEQEPYTRLFEMGKQTQHCNARIQLISFSRYGRDRKEVFTLTGGDLRLGSVFLYTEKSADAIVVAGNELPLDQAEDSRRSEGQNVALFQYILDAFSKPLVNENKGVFGEKSVYTDM